MLTQDDRNGSLSGDLVNLNKSRVAGEGDAVSKYNIDQELAKIAKIKMPDNPALLPLMNRIIGLSKCRSDDTVVVTRHKTPGYGGAVLDTLVIEPVHHKGELPCMVLYHGGGFVLKASFAHHSMAKLYASGLPCKVIYTDYRLAPKNPFPVPAEDCYCTYKWALEHTDGAHMIIAGDSAGGDLALAVSLMARDRGLRMPDAELLVYPVTDRRMTTISMKKYVDTPVFDAKLSKMMWDAYLGDRQPERIEYASPLEAASFARFPPTYIEVAQFDALHDEGVLLYQKLREQEILAELHEVNGACHGFETATKSNLLKTCMERRIDWLRFALNNVDKEA